MTTLILPANTLNGVPQSPTPAPIPNYQDVDLGSIPYLVMMEEHGIRLDPAPLAIMSRDLAVRIDEQQNQAWAAVGEAFNLGSNKQVGELLFGKLGFAPTKRTRSKEAWSVEDEVLQALKGQHKVIGNIIEYRRMDKLKGTYVDALPKLVDSTGRIHPRWQGTRVETGRLSCTDPNVMNQPIRHEEGRQVRKAWVAEEGNILLEADYGQVELRCLAHITGEPNMVKAFWNGDDIHKSTAADVYEIKMTMVNFDQRRDAKVVNFGIPYGLSPHGLVESVPAERRDPSIHTLEWATKFMDAYFAKYPKVAEFISLTHDFARKHGWVEDVFKRRRWIPEAMSTQYRVRAAGERMAQNMPIQATAAGIIRRAMGMLVRLDGDGTLDPFIEAGAVLTVAQIHDSLIFEVMKELADVISEIVKRTMEAAAPWFLVPLVVDVARGNNWIEFKE